jgi:ribosomal subunit interface protein
MQLQISGKNIDTGDALRQHVSDRISDAVEKYFDRTVDAHVTFTKEGFAFHCNTQVHLSSGMMLQAHGEAAEVYAAFDNAMERLEKRLRRYKRRLKNHHGDKSERAAYLEAPSFVIQAEEEDTNDEPDTLEPIIVAEGTQRVPTLTVGEAVMVMEFQDTTALMFRNSAHGGFNVVYRRADGNIGWVDPPRETN